MSGGKDGLRGLLASRARMRCPALLAAAVLAGALALPASAFATSAQTWVAYYGTDSGTCPASSPCASFAYALTQTSAGGEVDALTSGSYGPVTVSQPVTINGNGTNATIDFTGSEGVFVSLSTPGNVVLNDLSINGVGLGSDAVYDGLGTVEIDNSQISGYMSIGVGVGDSNSTISENTVAVRHTTINGDGVGALGVRTFQGMPGSVTLENDVIEGNTQAGIFTRATNQQLVVNNTQIEGNQIGVQADTGPWHFSFTGDQINSNTTAGMLLYAPGAATSGSPTQVALDNTQLAYNGTSGIGIIASGSGPMQFSLQNDQIEYNVQDGVDLAPAGALNATLDGDSIFGNGGAGAVMAAASATALNASLAQDSVSGNACGIVATTVGPANGCTAGSGTPAAGTSAKVTSSSSSLNENTGTGVFSDGAGASNLLSGDTVSKNAIGLQVELGGTIVSLGANNSVFGNTTDGAPTSTMTTGAVGPMGLAGTNGTNGTQGATGAIGPAGAVGQPGAAGQIEIVTCTNVKKKVKHKTVTQKKCTTKLVSSPASFKASAASASISRAGHVDASGSLRDGKLTLHASKALRAGRYTLTLTTGIGRHRRTSTETIALT